MLGACSSEEKKVGAVAVLPQLRLWIYCIAPRRVQHSFVQMVLFGGSSNPSVAMGLNQGLAKSRLKTSSLSSMSSGRLSRQSLRGFVPDSGQQELSGCFSGATSAGSGSSNVSVASGSVQSSPRGRGRLVCVSCKEDTQIATSKLYSRGCSDARQCNQCNAISTAMIRHSVANDQILKQFRNKNWRSTS